jgi:hypothetical protein
MLKLPLTIATNAACEHRAEPVPPVAHRLMANVDAALEQQALHIPQRQREADVHHHYQADHLVMS